MRGKIYGVVHCYIGEEAVAVGVCSALDRGDRIISTHRGHGHCIAKGADLNRMMAELYGRQTGYCKGKGGSMHIADFGIGMLGANGIVAGGISIVTGAGLAAQMEGKGGVAVCLLRRWRVERRALPRVPEHRGDLEAADDLRVREQRLGRANLGRRDARDDRRGGHARPATAFRASWWTATTSSRSTRRRARAVERARAGDGPTLIECKTYRWRAHTERKGQPDPRDRAEVEAWKRQDPIALLERQLRDQGDLDDAGLRAMEGEIMGALEAAVAFAEASPHPLPEQATDDVFAA